MLDRIYIVNDKKIGENMDKVSFIVETLANINQSILLIYFYAVH